MSDWRSGFKIFFLPVIGCSATVPYDDDFLRTLKVSHGSHMTLAAILKADTESDESRAKMHSKVVPQRESTSFVTSQTDSMLIFTIFFYFQLHLLY